MAVLLKVRCNNMCFRPVYCRVEHITIISLLPNKTCLACACRMSQWNTTTEPSHCSHVEHMARAITHESEWNKSQIFQQTPRLIEHWRNKNKHAHTVCWKKENIFGGFPHCIDNASFIMLPACWYDWEQWRLLRLPEWPAWASPLVKKTQNTDGCCFWFFRQTCVTFTQR